MTRRAAIVIGGLALVSVSVWWYRSTSGEERVEASLRRLGRLYEERLERWPVPHECLWVATSYGQTHVIASGPTDAKPVVLIHAFGITSTMWAPNVAQLSSRYRVYAIDTIGDLGKSRLADSSRFPRSGSEYSSWLCEVLDGLAVGRTHVVGASMGGWLALNYARHAPERVDRVVLLAPMGIPSVGLKTMGYLASVVLLPGQERRERFIRWALGERPHVLRLYGDYMREALNLSSTTRVSPPTRLSDEALGRIEAPVLLVLGGKDGPLGPPAQSAARARKLIRRVEVEILPDCGHLLSVEEPERVNRLILDFLSPPDGPRARPHGDGAGRALGSRAKETGT